MGSGDELLRGAFTHHRLQHPDQYEGRDFRPKADSEAARLQAEVKAGLLTENPHEAEYIAARDEFHSKDESLIGFKRECLNDRLAELDAIQAVETIRQGWELLARGCEEYAGAVEHTRAVILDTEGLDGRDRSHDTSPGDWLKLARDVLDGEIAAPGLNPHTVEKLRWEKEQAEAWSRAHA